MYEFWLLLRKLKWLLFPNRCPHCLTHSNLAKIEQHFDGYMLVEEYHYCKNCNFYLGGFCYSNPFPTARENIWERFNIVDESFGRFGHGFFYGRGF